MGSETEEKQKPKHLNKFIINFQFTPKGDQPQAIKELVEGYKAGNKTQTLLGVTGSGKTFTAAHVIAEFNRPTLLIAPNKTLVSQLYAELKQLFLKIKDVNPRKKNCVIRRNGPSNILIQ